MSQRGSDTQPETNPGTPGLGSGPRPALPSRAPRAGDTVAGCTLERELGRGGMGAVFLGREPSGDAVAVKVMLDPSRSETARERFRRECSALGALDHPGIVRVLRADAEGSRPSLVMELVEGRDLEAVLTEGELDLDARLELVEQVCRAIHHAHERGIVHRDLKPANVLVTEGGQPKVTDFGLVRELGRDTRLTKTGAAMGTPGYMSPEQVRGEKTAGPLSDVFALGALLYEVLVGETPFAGDSAVEVLARIVKSDPEPPSTQCPWAGPAHDAVVLKALAKTPEARYPSAAALADAIANLREHGGGSTLPRAVRRAAIAALGVLALGGAIAALATHEGPLSEAEVEAVSATLVEETQAWLSVSRSIEADAPAARDLLTRLEALDARTDPDARPPRSLRQARRELHAVRGLLELAAGDVPAAQATLASLDGRGTPALRALRGGCAARSDEPRAGVRDLGAALAEGVGRLDLHRWRLNALAESELSEADAKLVLEDVEALKQAGAVRAAERARGVHAHLALGQLTDAEQALGEIPEPPLDLRWAVALAVGDRQLEDDPRPVLERLQALPAQSTPDPRRIAMADRALQRVRSLLAKIGSRYKLRKPEREALIVGLRLAHLLAPRDLPADLLAPLQDIAVSFKGSGDLDLACCLADVHPDDYDMQLAAGYLAQRIHSAGPKRRCSTYLRRAAEIAPDAEKRHEARVALCLILAQIALRRAGDARRDECEEAVALATDLLPRVDNPSVRAELLESRAAGLRVLGDHQAALRDLADAMELVSDMPGLHLVRMWIHYDLGNVREAFEDGCAYSVIRAANDASTKSDQAVVLVWSHGRKLGEEQRVLQVLRSLLRGRDHYVSWWVRLAYLELRTGDVARAREHMDWAVHKFGIFRSGYKHMPDYERRLEIARDAVKTSGAEGLGELEAFVEWLEARRLAKGFWTVGR